MICKGLFKSLLCVSSFVLFAVGAFLIGAGIYVFIQMNQEGWAEYLDYYPYLSTVVEVFMMSKILCVFCFDICTPWGKGGVKEGSANFKTWKREPLISKLP